MRDDTWEKGNEALTQLANNSTDTPEIRTAINDIRNLLYAYHEATNVIESIESKIAYHKKGENESMRVAMTVTRTN